MANKRVVLVIKGRVQGVFFRAAAQREARRLGITGWVKNRTDGSVEVLAEGDEDSIKELTIWANHGRSAARVDQVDVRWRGYTGEFAEFAIIE
jgi:acylphosphatase